MSLASLKIKLAGAESQEQEKTNENSPCVHFRESMGDKCACKTLKLGSVFRVIDHPESRQLKHLEVGWAKCPRKGHSQGRCPRLGYSPRKEVGEKASV